MRQDTQIMGRELNKQNLQGSGMQQEKRKMGSWSPSRSKKLRKDSCNREVDQEFMGNKKQGVGMGTTFESHSRGHEVLSTSELVASNIIQHKNPAKIKHTELSCNKVETADLGAKGPGQSARELSAKRAMLFKERGRSYLAQKRPKTNQHSNHVHLKQEDLMPASETKSTAVSKSAGDGFMSGRELSLKEGCGKTSEREKHFTTSEVAARSGKIRSRSPHLSTSEVASGNACKPNVHLSTSEVAAKKRRIERRLNLHSKESKPVQHLSTSEVAAKHKSIAHGAGKNPQRSTSEAPAQHDEEGVRQRIKSKHVENRNRHLDDQRKHREAEEERRRVEENMRERRRVERRAEEMRREEERLEERLREKKREERMIEERIQDKMRAEEKRIEEEIIAQRIREKKREEKMIEERIREKRREERKAAARLIEPRSTSEVAAKVALSRASAVVDMVSEASEEEDIVVERVEQAAPSQMFPVLEAHRKKHHAQREISPPKFYNKLDSDSESGNEDDGDGEDDEVVAIREDLRNPPKRSTSEMFVENLKKLKTSQKQWFEAPHKKTSDNLFEQLLERNKQLEKKKDVGGSKQVKERVDEFLESCQRILPDADFPPVFKKISKYMSSISKVSPVYTYSRTKDADISLTRSTGTLVA